MLPLGFDRKSSDSSNSVPSLKKGRRYSNAVDEVSDPHEDSAISEQYDIQGTP